MADTPETQANLQEIVDRAVEARLAKKTTTLGGHFWTSIRTYVIGGIVAGLFGLAGLIGLLLYEKLRAVAAADLIQAMQVVVKVDVGKSREAVARCEKGELLVGAMCYSSNDNPKPEILKLVGGKVPRFREDSTGDGLQSADTTLGVVKCAYLESGVFDKAVAVAMCLRAR